ncbi:MULTISPECIES: hypothetical protein [unclassified Paenibacillus]|uniref:hypothetical protein n=1 Tax=unclassified Paenibacillus TaxID=185978 RepID=UPI0030F99168
MVEKPITFGAAEACGPDMVEKPITFGAAVACGPDVVEKPITFGAAEACGPDVVEKPTTFSAAEACGPNVVEKPTTFSAAEACGPNVVEKPTTFGAAETCGPDVVEKPATIGAAEACGPDMVEKPITMGMPQAFCSCFMVGIGLGGGLCELSGRETNMCMKNRIQWRVRRRVGGCMSKSEYHVATASNKFREILQELQQCCSVQAAVRETTLRMDQIYQSGNPTLWGYFACAPNSLLVQGAA